MSTEREELTTVIHDAQWVDGKKFYRSDGQIADAVIDAGYRKPQTLNAAEELDALVGGCIVRAVKSEHNPYGLCFEKYGKEWLALDPGDREDGEETIPSTAVINWYGKHSITVLYVPEPKP